MAEAPLAPKHGSVVGALAISFAVGWVIVSLSAVAPALATAYKTSLGAVGLLTTTVFIVHAMMQLPSGHAADRFGPRAIGIAGLVLMVAANLLATIASLWWLALLSRVVLGVGTGLVFLTGLVYMRRRGASTLLVGVFGAVNGAASGLALAILPQLEPVLHWRGSYITSAVFSAFALVAVLAGPPTPADINSQTGAATVIVTLIRDRALLRLAQINLAAAGCSSIIAAWVVALLVRAGGFTAGTAGAVGALTLFGSVLSRPLGGWVIHHRPRLISAMLVVSIALGVGGTLALAFSGPLTLAILGSASVGIASGLPWAYAFSGAAAARPDAAALAVAYVNTTGLAMIILGIPLVGLTFSLTGHGRLGFVALAALWAATVVVMPRRGTAHGVPTQVHRPDEAAGMPHPRDDPPRAPRLSGNAASPSRYRGCEVGHLLKISHRAFEQPDRTPFMGPPVVRAGGW